MPHLIDELTPEETKKIEKIDAYYRPLLNASMSRLNIAMKKWTERTTDYDKELADELEAASSEETALNAEWLEARKTITDAAEERLFLRDYDGQTEKIVKLIKTEVPRLIAVNRVFAGDEPTELERQEQAERAKKNQKEIIEAIAFNEQQLKDRPDDEELKQATADLKEMLSSGSYDIKPLYDIIHSDDNLRAEILQTFARYLDYLKKNAPDEYTKALAYIDACIEVKKQIYEEKIQGEPQRKKDAYRTKAKAGTVYRNVPDNLAIATFPGYQHSMSLYQNGNAYLQPLTSTDGLKFQNGLMYFAGKQMRRVSEVELQNMKTKEGIENIDLALLRVFYSIILSAFEATNCKTLKPNITLFVPDLAEFLGLQRNLNKQDLARVISKTQQFHNIVGVMHETRNGKPTQSLYQVLNFESYDDKKNTITFSSPYMNHVIETVYNIAIRRDKKGAPRLKSNGEPMRLVSHSYLVKSEISKERNKTAVENVIIITTLIEQAGENVPRIKASTIIERNPQLQQRLENSTNKRQFLKRTFEKTWELLRTKTRLQEVYKNIQLPDPKDPANIPTVATLESTVFSFPHDGKKQEK